MAKDLISRILVKDPQHRFNAEDILNHPWLIGEVTPTIELHEVPPKIKEYSARQKLKRGVTAVKVVVKINKILE